MDDDANPDSRRFLPQYDTLYIRYYPCGRQPREGCAVSAQLCAEALRTGEANVGLIPVAAIPEIPDLQIITPFCIGASGPVRTRRARVRLSR